MSTLKKLYLKKMKNLKMFNSTLLLAELIYLNYEFSNKEYEQITGNDVWDIMLKTKYSQKEKEQIIKNSMILLNIKYGIKLEKDLLKQFLELNIEK